MVINMKKLSKKLFAFILIVAVAVSALPTAIAAENEPGLFGRYALSTMNNGACFTEAYDRVAECVENRESSTDLSDLSITESELELVVETYRNDPHGHFWVAPEFYYSSYPDGSVAEFLPIYNSLSGASEAEFNKTKSEYDKAANDILRKAGVTAGMSEYEKERRIHNALIQGTVYEEGTNAHNSYGAIVEKKAVCQGYALAFQYLLRLAGIQAFSVVGTAGGGPHSWNIVRIDGKYYHTDVTWDDPITAPAGDDSDIFYEYFNITDREMARDHAWYVPPFGLPECNEREHNYFTKNPSLVMKSSDVTAKKIASLMNDGFVRLYVSDGNPSAVCSWFSNNCTEVAILAGFDLTYPASISYSYLKNEVHLIISGTLIEKEPEFLLGDMDLNGSVNSVDSNILKRINAGNMMASESHKINGDMNSDGVLSSIDSNLLKRKIAGA